MNIKPEERSKVIMLGIATAIVLTYVIFTTVSRINGAAAPPTNPSTGASTAQAGSAATSPAAPGTGAQDTTLGTPGGMSPAAGNFATPNTAPVKTQDIYADVAAPVTTRDPFTPIIPIGQDAGSPLPVRPMQPMSQPQLGPRTVVTTYPVIKRNMPTFNPDMGAGNRMGSGGLSTTPTPPEPETTLAGVIAGPSAASVAVLHIADRAYEVMPGDRLPNDLALARVTDSGVYVTRGQQKWFIRIGKTLHSAMPIKINAGPSRPPRTLRATMPFPTTGLAASARMGDTPRTIGNTLGQ